MTLNCRVALVLLSLTVTISGWARADLSALDNFSESGKKSADWTIAVYIAGDNDLEKYSLIDLNEMELGIDGKVNVIALVDRAEGYDDSGGNWTDARVYRLSSDSDKTKLNSRIIARVGEVNMGDPAVLERFLASTLRHFPAKRNALVLWNHGGGWAVHALDQGIPGSDHGQDSLTMPELSGAIKSALKSVNKDKLDLVGFDMCLMAQYEVAVELAPVADYLVASQATEPGDGWPYDRVLPAFARGKSKTRDLASHIVEAFDSYYREKQEPITTLAAFDLSRLQSFTDSFNLLLAKLEKSADRIWPDISRSIFFAEGYAARSDLQRSKDALASIDILDALRRMQLNVAKFPATEELEKLEKAAEKLLINYKNSKLRRRSNGLAIYAPITQAVYNDKYEQLSVSSTSGWRSFLGMLHRLQQANDRAPVIRDMQLVDWKAEKPISAAKPLNTHGISYVVEGTNILWLNGMKGQWDEEREGIYVFHRSAIVDADWSIRSRETATDRLDLLIPEFRDGVNSIVTDEPGYRYAIFDGKQGFFATVDESGQSGDYITVPIIYHHPEAGDLGGTIYFQPQWWYAAAVELELPQSDGTIVYRQINPEPDHELTLLFEYLAKDGKISYARGERIKWNKGPELLLGLDTPGKYVFGLIADTIGGNSSNAMYEYSLAEDPDLQAFIKKGSDFDKDDLIGVWEMIEPETFQKTGQVVPNGILLEYRQHPEKKPLLLSELTAPQKNPDFVDRNLVFFDGRMLPHTRSFDMGQSGIPEDPLGVEFAVDLVSLYIQKGRPIMIQRNTVSGLTYVFAKRVHSQQQNANVPQPGAYGQGSGGQQGGYGQQQPGAQPQQPGYDQPQGGFGQQQPGMTPQQPGGDYSQPQQQILTLDGVWQRQDGTVLIIQGQQYQINQMGMAIDAGMFMIEGNMIVSQSAYTGVTEQYLFGLQGNILQLQDAWGGLYVYQRLQ